MKNPLMEFGISITLEGDSPFALSAESYGTLPLRTQDIAACQICDPRALRTKFASIVLAAVLPIQAPLRVHNQTDLTLVVRFHDAQKRAVIPVDLRSSSACEASLLGSAHSCDRGTSIFSGRIRQLPETALGELLLPPHTICA
ncbi:unnamed protein product, partial [Symbiodinium sp. KB8]